MKHPFPDLKSQAEIDTEDFGFKCFKRYMYISIGLSVTFYVVVIIALLKWIFS